MMLDKAHTEILTAKVSQVWRRQPGGSGRGQRVGVRVIVKL